MTTQETTEETTEETSGGGLRKQLEGALTKVKDLEAVARTRAFSDAGFDTSKGLGKAIAQVYDGEVTSEAILKFAADEYEFTPTDENAPQPHPQAAQIALGQQQLDQVGNVAGSVQPGKSRVQRLQEARQTGDMKTEGAIMAAQMVDMMKAQNQGFNG